MAARTKIGARIPELITRRLIVDPCVNAVVKTAGLIAAYRVIKKKIEESSAARAAAAESRGDAP